MRRKFLTILFTLTLAFFCRGQGLNHQWLQGYDTGLFDSYVTSSKARILFTSTGSAIIQESRKMAFYSAQANISDENGNLLMATNGCWIMNALGDTMLNGSGLNPDPYTTQWCDAQSGIPYPHANVFLPFPEDSLKYILFHHSGNSSTQYQDLPSELYYSIVDMNLDGGLGGVTQKNVVVMQDHLSLGIAACKHANGRDWWVVMLKDSSDVIYKILLTPQGISSVITQSLGLPDHQRLAVQPIFSPDGSKFAYRYYYGTPTPTNNEVRLFDFNRCTGDFSNPVIIYWQNLVAGVSVNFSSNSQYIYATTFDKVYQINTDTTDIPASLKIVAVNDGYCFPYSFTCTDFWMMYLAANGKIYISSGNSVIDMHYINYPDSADISCDVQQHALQLPCYNFRINAYHPNYYLGCDTTLGCTPCYIIPNVNEVSHNFKFNIYPNPSSGNFSIIYLLPHASTGSATEEGKLEIIDVTGKVVYEMRLPQWSTLQQISLPQNISNGIYNCVITAGYHRTSKKIAIIKE